MGEKDDIVRMHHFGLKAWVGAELIKITKVLGVSKHEFVEAAVRFFSEAVTSEEAAELLRPHVDFRTRYRKLVGLLRPGKGPTDGF